jgi:TolB-like protein
MNSMSRIALLMVLSLAVPSIAATAKTKGKAAVKKPVDPPPEPVPEVKPPPPEVKPEPAPTPVVEKPAPKVETPIVGKPQIIVLNLTAAGGVEVAVAESLTEALAAELSRTGLFEVTTQKDVAVVLGVERQRQLLGCGEESSSCATELAGALGARFVLSGSVAKLGDVFQLNLQTQDTTKGQALGRATRIAKDLPALRGQLPYAIADATATPQPIPPSKVPSVTLLAVGGAAVVGAGVVFLVSFSTEQTVLGELNLAGQPNVQLKPAQYYRDQADAVRMQRLIGGIAAGVGAALMITGIIVYPRDDAAPVKVSLVPTGTGAAVVGSW